MAHSPKLTNILPFLVGHEAQFLFPCDKNCFTMLIDLSLPFPASIADRAGQRWQDVVILTYWESNIEHERKDDQASLIECETKGVLSWSRDIYQSVFFPDSESQTTRCRRNVEHHLHFS